MQTNAQLKPAAESKSKDIVIRAIDVKRYYGEGDNVTKALDGVTLDVYRGEYLSIMGPSGSGKSTLFNMVGGIVKSFEAAEVEWRTPMIKSKGARLIATPRIPTPTGIPPGMAVVGIRHGRAFSHRVAGYWIPLRLVPWCRSSHLDGGRRI